MADLYLVPLPIGNPGDLSPRAVETLQAVDLILVEDTRVAGLHLAGLDLKARFISYHAHNEQQRNQEILTYLSQGLTIALVSDAGMPVISDPGASLVRLLLDSGYKVTALPGPNAALTALIASGLSADRFTFEGFLGKKSSEIRNRLMDLQTESRTMIFYEAPHRLRKLLRALIDCGFDRREICLARELTKNYEEYLRGSVDDLAQLMNEREPRGEYVIVLEGARDYQKRCPEEFAASQEGDLDLAIKETIAAGLHLKQASKDLAQRFDLPARDIYRELLEAKSDQD